MNFRDPGKQHPEAGHYLKWDEQKSVISTPAANLVCWPSNLIKTTDVIESR